MMVNEIKLKADKDKLRNNFIKKIDNMNFLLLNTSNALSNEIESIREGGFIREGDLNCMMIEIQDIHDRITKKGEYECQKNDLK